MIFLHDLNADNNKDSINIKSGFVQLNSLKHVKHSYMKLCQAELEDLTCIFIKFVKILRSAMLS